MKPAFLSLCFVQLVMFANLSCSLAESRYFLDDFEDGDPHDFDRANWQRGAWNGGDLFPEDGDLYINDCRSGGCAIAPKDENGDFLQYEDISVRVQAHLTDGSGAIAAWSRWLKDGYYALVRPSTGSVSLGKTNVDRAWGQMENVDEDVDTVVKLDVIGDEISLSAWLAEDEPMELPVASFRDGSLRKGIAGVTILPDGLASVVYRWIEFAEIIPGDVDTNSLIDVADIDHLSSALRNGLDNNRYDVNRDGNVDSVDHRSWVKDIKHTWFGDANLDGEFNSSDFVQVFQAGEYEDDQVAKSTWATGDWNGDGEFGSQDFVKAFQDGGYEKGPLAAVSVPEPASLPMLLASLIGLVTHRCRSNRRNDELNSPEEPSDD